MAQFMRLKTGADHYVVVNMEQIVLIQPIEGGKKINVILTKGDNVQAEAEYAEVERQLISMTGN